MTGNWKHLSCGSSAFDSVVF